MENIYPFGGEPLSKHDTDSLNQRWTNYCPPMTEFRMKIGPFIDCPLGLLLL